MNVLQGNVKLKKQQMQNLKKHRNIMRLLSNKSVPTETKRSILKQRGGFLPALIPIAVSALTSIIPSLFQKA